MMATNGLTPRQQRFVDEYLIDLNATQAAIRSGYSAKTADQQASRLLTNVKVSNAVAIGRKKQTKRSEVTADRVLAEFAKIGFGDLRGLFDAQGNLLRPDELSDDDAARIAAIEVVVRPKPGGTRGEIEYVHKIKAWDKVAALTQIGRHLGMFKDGVELSGNISINITPDDAAL